MSNNLKPLLHRVAETGRAVVPLRIDGQPAQALAGDTVLTAVLTQQARLRVHERTGAPYAGFCLMGACQDCWVQLVGGERLRACATPVQPGMDVRTDGGWR
jgi:predicted molibdopterin-dependent oxidoreductase YjgC